MLAGAGGVRGVTIRARFLAVENVLHETLRPAQAILNATLRKGPDLGIAEARRREGPAAKAAGFSDVVPAEDATRGGGLP